MTEPFEKSFAIEEAVGLLPYLRQTFAKAHQELKTLQDELILYQRMAEMRLEEQLAGVVGASAPQAMQDIVGQKRHAFEQAVYHWLEEIEQHGIMVKDFRRGLVDFPYRAQDGTWYLLCWELSEDGLFYFHAIDGGFSGRYPISLLPA